MLLEIRGHHLPGRSWHLAGTPCHNVHVGIQLGREPAELVPGDADAATWTMEVTLRVLDENSTDFRGPAVQGKHGARFVYLTWGNVREDGSFAMFRRAKLMLDDLGTLINATHVVASVDLTDECGSPRCARLRPPALELRAA